MHLSKDETSIASYLLQHCLCQFHCTETPRISQFAPCSRHGERGEMVANLILLLVQGWQGMMRNSRTSLKPSGGEETSDVSHACGKCGLPIASVAGRFPWLFSALPTPQKNSVRSRTGHDASLNTPGWPHVVHVSCACVNA